MHSCSNELMSKISKPAISKMPMKEDTDTRFVLMGPRKRRYSVNNVSRQPFAIMK